MSSLPPLSPAVGGKCMDPDFLHPADILVSADSGRVSKGITLLTLSDVSHAFLYIGDGWIIQALGVKNKVSRDPLNSAIKGATLVVAYRRKSITDLQAKQVVNYAKNQRNKPYDYIGASTANLEACVKTVTLPGANVIAVMGTIYCVTGAILNRLDNVPKTFFCSELIIDAFKSAHLPIVQGLDTDPKSIVTAYSRGVLDYVGHLVP